MENTIFTLKDGMRLHITLSIGCSTYPDISKEQLLEIADKRLYSAKRKREESGRHGQGIGKKKSGLEECALHSPGPVLVSRALLPLHLHCIRSRDLYRASSYRCRV
ncbi:hypothetical protein [Paenibacillus lutimineralis]|uniref:hypothetical protein n=1 Tax=Paenibacillus lutimineralis TaxID=2707005 RepID=UPI0013A64A01